MRRRGLLAAARLLSSRAAGVAAAPDATAAPLYARTAAGSMCAASTSSPPVTAGLRLASTTRGLACPPHGGGRSSSTDGGGGGAAVPDTNHDPAGEAAYHAAADDALHALLDGLEAWVDDTPGLADVDVEYSSGVLTLSLGPGRGTYVLNKQAPNRQLWLSSPVSGPLRYDHVGGKWVYARDGSELGERLRKELAELTGSDPPAI